MSLPEPPRFARAPAAVNAAVVALILVVVTVLGVSAVQTPPPEIAAFAPQLQSQPNSSASNANLGAAGAAAPSGVPSTPAPTPTPSVSSAAIPSNSPAIRHCYGDPPRQTPDPQSPPCVPYFDPTTPNGGATSPGVTADTIYVAWPDLSQGGFYATEPPGEAPYLAKYMNDHFTFYGRHIKLIPFTVNGSAFSSNSAAQMQQDAEKVHSALNPGVGIFASLAYAPVGGAAFYYYNQLAHDGVVSVDSDVQAVDYTAQEGPYEWETVPGTEGFMTNEGGLVCNRLQGQPPSYAGQPPLGTQWSATRTFRVVVGGAGNSSGNAITWDYKPLVDALTACHMAVQVDRISGSNSDAEAINLKQAGITTVLCVCGAPDTDALMKSAQNQQYFPEWVVTGTGSQNQDSSSSTSGGNAGNYPASALSHIIGITFDNKWDAPGSHSQYWYQAMREEDPTYAYHDNGLDPGDYYRYEQLMVLAAGIQAAGPDLTPQTFEDGLYRDHFANPGSGAPPDYQARVGFAPGDHHFFQDAAAIWFDAQATNYTTYEPRTGSFCYSRGGQRSIQWTDVAPLFYGGQSCR